MINIWFYRSGLEQEDMRTLYKYLVTSLFPSIDFEVGWRIFPVCFTFYFSLLKASWGKLNLASISIRSINKFTVICGFQTTSSIVIDQPIFFLSQFILFTSMICLLIRRNESKYSTVKSQFLDPRFFKIPDNSTKRIFLHVSQIM